MFLSLNVFVMKQVEIASVLVRMGGMELIVLCNAVITAIKTNVFSTMEHASLYVLMGLLMHAAVKRVSLNLIHISIFPLIMISQADSDIFKNVL